MLESGHVLMATRVGWGGGGPDEVWGQLQGLTVLRPSSLLLTDFVALLTGPRSQAVARARVSLQRSSLRFSISYQR